MVLRYLMEKLTDFMFPYEVSQSLSNNLPIYCGHGHCADPKIRDGKLDYDPKTRKLFHSSTILDSDRLCAGLELCNNLPAAMGVRTDKDCTIFARNLRAVRGISRKKAIELLLTGRAYQPKHLVGERSLLDKALGK